MHLHLHELVAENFKSFSGKHVIPLDMGIGLFSITGENLVSPKLGSNGAGKCLPGWTKIYDPKYGEVSIEEAVKNQLGSVLGYTKGRIAPVAVSDWHELGPKPVVKISAQGYSIDCGEDHPLLTPTGWKKAGELSNNDFVAVASKLPIRGVSQFSDEEVRLAGYLIADGSINSGARLCATKRWKVDLYLDALAKAFPLCEVVSKSRSVYLGKKKPNIKYNSKIASLIKKQGFSIWYFIGSNTSRFLKGKSGLSLKTLKKIQEKRVNLGIYYSYAAGNKALEEWCAATKIKAKGPNKSLGEFNNLPENQIPLLLAALWEADGYISDFNHKQSYEVSYCTASKLLAKQIQAQLLRLGIENSVCPRKGTGDYTQNTYYNVSIRSQYLKTFAELIKLQGPKGEKLQNLTDQFNAQRKGLEGDLLPYGIWDHEITAARASAWRAGKKRLSKRKYLELGGNPNKIDNDLRWVKINQVEKLGQKDCFDISVNTNEHAYVADCFITHNSTVLDALWFCLFGKSVRGLRASDLRNWSKTKGPAVVTLKLVVDEDACELRRQWNPNKLEYLSPENELSPITQEQIIEWLGLTEEEARHCLLIGQHESMFFDMKPMEKQNLFTDVLLLETWTALSKEASAKAAVVEQAIRTIQGAINDNETKAELLREQAEQHLQKAEEAEEERLGRLEAIDNSLEEMRGTYQNLKADTAALDKRRKKLPKTDKLQAEFEKAVSAQEQIEQDLGALNQDVQGTARDITKTTGALSKMKTLSGSCTRCGQQITAAHKKKEVKALTEELKALGAEEDELLTSVEELQEELDDQSELCGELENKLDGSQAESGEIERTALRLENDESILEGQIAHKEQAATELEESDNVFDELAKQSLETADGLDREGSLLQRKVTASEATCANYNFWVTGYKEIRLSVIETALDQLEIETNNYLAKFGLLDWYVFFDTEKENKSGTTTKGFTVSIQSPEVDKPVPWEAWSGGETQRLKLSGTLGLMSLLLNRRGLSTNLLLLDEPTTHLGGSGVPDLLDLLADFAEDEAKTIWFIDHRTEEYGRFDGNLHVTKDSKGSKVALNV